MKGRHIDQWNTIEKPEIDLQKYNQLIFDKGAKVIPWGKGPFQQIGTHVQNRHVQIQARCLSSETSLQLCP